MLKWKLECILLIKWFERREDMNRNQLENERMNLFDGNLKKILEIVKQENQKRNQYLPFYFWWYWLNDEFH